MVFVLEETRREIGPALPEIRWQVAKTDEAVLNVEAALQGALLPSNGLLEALLEIHLDLPQEIRTGQIGVQKVTVME